MAKTFTYKMMNADGQTISGIIVAENERTVAAYIREKGNYVTEIKEEKNSLSVRLLSVFYRLSLKELAVFLRQFAAMAEAGIAITDILRIIIEETKNPKFKTVLEDVYLGVQRGEALSVSLKAHSEFFPPFMANMLFAAEEGGMLDLMLNRLALHFEKEYKFRRKIYAAMFYPLIIAVFSVLVIAFLLTFALPPLASFLTSMNVELPFLTVVLLETSSFLQAYYLQLAAALLFTAYFAGVCRKYPRVRKMQEKLLFALPVFGSLHKKTAIARFSRTLAALSRSGIPIVHSLEIVKEIFPHSVMADILTNVKRVIVSGRGIAAALRQNAFFPPMVTQMIAAGEEAGQLEKMLEKIADFYDEDIDDTLSKLSSIVEPVLIGVLGVTVGLMVAAVLLPIFEISSSINQF